MTGGSAAAERAAARRSIFQRDGGRGGPLSGALFH